MTRNCPSAARRNAAVQLRPHGEFDIEPVELETITDGHDSTRPGRPVSVCPASKAAPHTRHPTHIPWETISAALRWVDVTTVDAEEHIDKPPKRLPMEQGCNQSGNNGNGITIPHTHHRHEPVYAAAEMVHSKEMCDSIVMAVDNAAAALRDTPKALTPRMAVPSKPPPARGVGAPGWPGAPEGWPGGWSGQCDRPGCGYTRRRTDPQAQ